MHSYSFIPVNTAIINPCPLSMTGSAFTGGGSKDRGTLQTLSHSAGSIKRTQQRWKSYKKTDTSISSIHLLWNLAMTMKLDEVRYIKHTALFFAFIFNAEMENW